MRTPGTPLNEIASSAASTDSRSKELSYEAAIRVICLEALAAHTGRAQVGEEGPTVAPVMT